MSRLIEGEMNLCSSISEVKMISAAPVAPTMWPVWDFVLLIAPFAPHFAEELHEMLGHKESVFKCAYPTCDEKALVRDEYEMAVQVNSRVKAKIVVPADADNKAIEAMALQDDNVKAALGDLKPVKVIVIPKRIVNIVAK